MTEGPLLDALLLACGTFAARAAETIDPAHARRLLAGSQYVAVRCEPARARLIIQAPTGETVVIHQAEGHDFPTDLGIAAARVIDAGLAQLSDRARRAVVGILADPAFTLGVLVSPDMSTVQILLDDGSPAPRVLATLQPDETTH